MKFKLIGPPVDLYKPPGAAESRYVSTGDLVEVEGTLAKEQPEDAVVVEHDGDVRAWPTAVWELQAPPKKKES